MGPLLFLIYILPLKDIIDQHGLLRHGYADDTQLYLHFPQRDIAKFHHAIAKLEACIEDVRTWMILNKLKLNDDKTEFMVITSKYYQKTYQQLNPDLTVGGVSIKPTKSVRNLGAMFDCVMSMETHVNCIKRSMHFHLRQIGKIRRYLDDDTCHLAVRSLVLSRLDYANILLLGLPQTLLHGLQVAQNTAARVISKTSRRDHITPVLKSLHWLPVSQRIKHKCLCMAFKSLHNQKAPAYIKQLLIPYNAQRSLRSGSQTMRLQTSKTKNLYGDRAFSVVAPKLWNALPSAIHLQSYNTFRKAVKTCLFEEHYRGQ